MPAESKKQDKFQLFHFALITFWCDVLGLLGSFVLAWWLRIGIFNDSEISLYVAACGIGLIVYQFLAFTDNMYSTEKLWKQFHNVYQAAKTIVLTFAVLLLLAFLLKITSNFSRIWGVSWLLIFLLYTVINRFILYRIFRNYIDKGQLATNVIIVGANKSGVELAESIKEIASKRFNVVGFLDDKPSKEFMDEDQGNYLGGVENIVNLRKEYSLDKIFVAFPLDEESKLTETIKYVSQWAIDVYWVSGARHQLFTYGIP